ncbi:hypothetical protein FRX31_003715 [Thalictrum thalictroides]|uniref:Uncharacterized protein n=1 Tax=Thalictrum thalictroides TaxID=46969 RepID=A0A7J6XAQ1_THATH|nr:hypothetical protein FRX31_003715 [Thalictrum thalictroides]
MSVTVSLTLYTFDNPFAIRGLTYWHIFVTGSIRACKVAALKCDEAKSEQYKQLMGDNITPEITESMQNCLEKIKILS